jgi:heme-degrading monooxygenase HmoA
MISRLWHGTTPTAKADAYLAFLKARALPDYRGTPGNRGAWILRRADGELTHFSTLTFWDSLDAIRAFAGDDIARAKYYPEDADFLLSFEPTVEHSDIHD